jgi:branched-chain amino acid transport system permease protein
MVVTEAEDEPITAVVQTGPVPTPWSRIASAAAHPDVRFGQYTAAGVLGFLILVQVLFPAPAAILVLGMVLGSVSALIAMGIVLIYRANRIINFAAGDLGGAAAMLGALLMLKGWPFFPAAIVGVTAALAVGAFVEFVIVRRFSAAPRLILTVATIGISQVLAFAQLFLPKLFGRKLGALNLPAPLSFKLVWNPVTFDGSHLLAVIVAVSAGLGLAWFLSYTRTGIAVRAASESSERAQQLGIPVSRINLMVWVLAAGLSALASLVRAPIVGVPLGQVLGPALLLQALAAAVVGRMQSLPVTFVTAVALGAIQQAVVWHTGGSLYSDAVLFAVILATLFIRSQKRLSRGEDTGTATWQAVANVRPVPPELRKLPEVRLGARGTTAVFAGFLVIAPMLFGVSRVDLLSIGVILMMVGLSMLILVGWAGEISLGQMAFYGFGMATAAKLASEGVNFFICLVAGGLVAAFVALILGFPALRIRGPFLAVITFAFALATTSYFLNPHLFKSLVVTSYIKRPVLFHRFDLQNDKVFYYLLLVILGLMLVSVRSLHRSRTGRALVAARDNARGAQSYGINVTRVRLTGYAMSGFLAGVAGAAALFQANSLAPTSYGVDQSLQVFSMVVFGGLGSVAGVLCGAVYFTWLNYFVRLAYLRLLISGAGLLLVLLLLPGGLGDVIYRLRDRFLRVVAARRGLVVPSLIADVESGLPEVQRLSTREEAIDT